MAQPNIESFAIPDTRSENEEAYFNALRSIAHELMYRTRNLDHSSISKQTAFLKRHKDYQALEKEYRGIEAIERLFLGTAMYERANFSFRNEWQGALNEQRASHPDGAVSGQELTHEDTEKEWDVLSGRDKMIQKEEETIDLFERFLKTDTEEIMVTDRISVDRSDIEGLINDLRIRQTNRIANEDERKSEVAKLDVELDEIIDRVPDHQFGKKMELMEIALIRRLIREADTGHLVSIFHGSPREDINPDFGSVDFWITSAGESFAFQVKTFKAGGRRNFYHQDTVKARAESQLAYSDTNLVQLDMEAVRDAYERMRRLDARTESTSLRDKYEALMPLSESLGDSGKALFELLGLNEADLTKEQKAFEERQEEMLRVREETIAYERQQRDEDARVEQEYQERLAREILEQKAAEEEIRQKQERILQEQEDARRASEEERRQLQEERGKKDAEARAKWERGVREAEERERREREEAEARAEEERKKEERRRKREERERNAPKWPPKKVADLKVADFLAKLGITPQDGANFILAKKKLLALIGKPARGQKEVNEAKSTIDKKAMSKLFPSEEAYHSPTPEDLNRIREAMGLPGADRNAA